MTYFPAAAALSEVDARSVALMRAGMDDRHDPVFLSVLSVEREALLARHPELADDAESARVLRSVLMKPEHERVVDSLHARVEALAAA